MSHSFQVLSWESADVPNDNNEDAFRITLFGRDQSGHSVACHTYFEPYFFIEIPNTWQKHNASALIYDKVPRKYHASITDIGIVTRKKFYGFTNNKVFRFARVVFQSKRAWSMAYYILRKDPKYANKIYEANIDPILRFIHIQNIESAGWVSVEKYTETTVCKETSCDHELFADSWKQVTPVQNDSIGPLVIASFDIETYSPDRVFPDPETECPVIQIATTYQRYGDKEPFRRHLLTLKKCDPIDSVNVVECDTERNLILRWSKSIQEFDPDILVGYNIWKFDLSYIFKRVRKMGIEHRFNINRYCEEPSKMYSAKFSSSAYGDNEYQMVSSKGRMQIDLLELYKREHKLVKYSLNAVSEHFLGDVKVDMPIPEMFDRYERGTSEDMHAIGLYCVKDTELPLRLMSKLNNIPNLVEMAKATCVPMNYLIERGQQIKVFSQIAKQTRLDEMLVITMHEGKTNESFVGATVLNAKSGAYMDKVVTGLDFASLYPTIMRAHNLCYNTIVLDDKYSNLDNVEYETVSWSTGGDNGEKSYKFAQNTQGTLPKLLENLAKNRKQAKKDMANAKDDFMKSVYNSKQLAFKVSMNSIYGFCAAFMLPCQPISASVTTIGRNMIEHTKNLVEEWYPGSEVIYGDSVRGDTPILTKNDGFLRIDQLFERFANDKKNGLNHAKEYAVPDHDVFVWSDTGFTKIKHVMRHKTTKRMYRVLTHTGVVDVTEDHSLLLENGQAIKPGEVTVGTRLLHREPNNSASDYKISEEEAKVMGFFFGDGSCGTYKCESGTKNTWALNNQDIDMLKQMKALAPFETKLYDTMNSSNVYKLNATGTNVADLVRRYRTLFYNNHKEKIVPECILNADVSVLQNFFDGYYMADGDKDTHGYIRFDCKGKQGTAGLVLVAQRLGYNVSINTRVDKRDIYRITCTKAGQRKDAMAIKKIENLGYTDEYVYDIETENHHFHVGPGNLIVHNTDSVMVIFNTNDATGQAMLEESFRLGEEAADRISRTFKRPIELEFEKCYWPYLLFSKKRYAGLMYTNTQKPDYIDAKGIQLVRRDNASFVREISKKVLNMIMYDRAVIEAAELVQQEARRLLSFDVPIDQLIVSKSLRKDYKNDKQPHLYVAQKIEERQPGSGPKCGERVPYVFMDTGNPKHLQFEKAEDPGYVIENGLQHKIDVLYYLKHSLLSPVESLFELFMSDAKEDIFGELIREFEKKKAKQTSITTFFTNFDKTPSTLGKNNKMQLASNTNKKKKPSSTNNNTKNQRHITLFM